jgi:hypothetical protein
MTDLIITLGACAFCIACTWGFAKWWYYTKDGRAEKKGHNVVTNAGRNRILDTFWRGSSLKAKEEEVKALREQLNLRR